MGKARAIDSFVASLDELDAEFGEVGLGAKCRNLRLQREGGVLIWQIGLIWLGASSWGWPVYNAGAAHATRRDAATLEKKPTAETVQTLKSKLKPSWSHCPPDLLPLCAFASF